MEIWPGPMEGVMSAPFVRAVNRLGLVDRWMTPFLRLTTACPREKYLKRFFEPFAAGAAPVTVQLMGVDPEVIGEAAARFRDLGAAEINLNFGCPSRQVTGGGAGGGALRAPDALLRMVERVKTFLPNFPLSVKLRAGWSSPEEAHRLLPALVRTGTLDRVFLHFRTVAEGYAPTPGREERLAAAVALLGSVPCIVNGDIRSAEEAHALAAATGGSGVMAARGWLRDPWLLRRIAGETELPDVETGRQRLFAEVLSGGFHCCRAIELSQFLWGRDNPWFDRLRQLPPGAEVGPELFR